MQQSIEKPVVLVGMMGAGKSYIGRKLAQRMGVPFYDSDAVIEKKAGRSISKIFEDNGEAAFRELEKQAFKDLIQKGVCVIASGGGAFIQEGTRSLIKAQAVSVWLQVDHETLYKRVKESSHRPLLNTENPQKTLKKIAEERNPIYAQADHAIKNCGESLSEILEKVLKCVYGHSKF